MPRRDTSHTRRSADIGFRRRQLDQEARGIAEIEFDPVESIIATAAGRPGQRTFYIQATGQGRSLVVLVEKEQVAILSERLVALVEQVASRFPEEEADPLPELAPAPEEAPVALFRALAIGLGFDSARHLLLVELHERPIGDGEEAEAQTEEEDEERYVARLFVTLAQARAMASRGAEAVAGGRPPCPFCRLPLDPQGHNCPRTNGHLRP
ncbi:MAG: DUF3090 family protein [Acidimicrobiia bacterium]